ncbi:MAG: hypothetical protein GKR77_00470 [Legionellales bacterium]|nr:hypothetical protein [Legionellales bacterium]
MKLIVRLFIGSLSLLISSAAMSQQLGTSNEKLEKYIKNLGSYYGIDVENDNYAAIVDRTDVFKNETTNWLELANKARASLIGLIPSIAPYLPAAPGSATAAPPQRTNTFLPTSSSAAPSSINSFLDKDPNQNNPTAQAIANIIIPPYLNRNNQCINCKNANQVLTTTRSLPAAKGDSVIEDISKSNLAEIDQLNLDSLLDPVAYNISRESASSGTGSPSSSNKDTFTGALTPTSEEVIAANFIRYVTNQVKNISYPSSTEFNDAYVETRKAIESGTSFAPDLLANYVANLRSYAAQASVGISNFNYLLAKRKLNTDSQTSQAAIEAEMATKELFDNEWYNRIELSSDSVVQRQMLYMLARMNYQLYLNRLMYERILATLSTMQLQALQQDNYTLNLTEE